MKLDKRTRDVQLTLDYDELSYLRGILVQHTVHLETILTQPNRSAENIMNIAKGILRCQDWSAVLNPT